MKFTFKKNEKLCSKTEISNLFAASNSVYVYPIKIIWKETKFNDSVPVKSVITVSKRRFKRAVDRNQLKRLMREAFRLNKNDLYQSVLIDNLQLSMILIYQTNEKLPFSKIERSLQSALKKLQIKLNS